MVSIAFLGAHDFDSIILAELRAAGAPPALGLLTVKAFIATESGFDAGAVNPEGSYGLMQIRLSTARRQKTRLDPMGFTGKAGRLLNPIINIRFGVALLIELWRRYNGKLAEVASAYNAGMNPDGSLKRDASGAFINPGYVRRVLDYVVAFRAERPARAATPPPATPPATIPRVPAVPVPVRRATAPTPRRKQAPVRLEVGEAAGDAILAIGALLGALWAWITSGGSRRA
ncbi:MAG: lytic transglycosylase domain-containing protein [Acidobacteriota bacterium]